MHHIRLVFTALLSILMSCENSSVQKSNAYEDSGEDTMSYINDQNDTASLNARSITPVMGYRFVVSGDFNGDGRQERLTEHYISGLTGQETHKFYKGLSDDREYMDSLTKKRPVSFLLCRDRGIDTLVISRDVQQYGLLFIKNVGDLNGDGTDEISYMVNWADVSSVNSCKIVTYRNKKWIELYEFDVWDWQVPELPGTLRYDGLTDEEIKIKGASDSSIFREQENELKAFKGLVKKLGDNRIEVRYMNVESDSDTKVVILPRINQVK